MLNKITIMVVAFLSFSGCCEDTITGVTARDQEVEPLEVIFVCFNVDDEPNQICTSHLEFIRYTSFAFAGTVEAVTPTSVFLKFDAELAEHKLDPGIHDFEVQFSCSDISSWQVITVLDGNVVEEVDGVPYGPCLGDTNFLLDIIAKYNFGDSVLFDSYLQVL